MENRFLHRDVLIEDEELKQLKWHDCPIHAVVFRSKDQIIVDIDYIQKWNEPVGNDSYYSFLLSPASLVFDWVVSCQLDVGLGHSELSIDNFELEKTPAGTFQCKISCHQGEIVLIAGSVSLLIRAEPVSSSTQKLASISRMPC